MYIKLLIPVITLARANKQAFAYHLVKKIQLSNLPSSSLFAQAGLGWRFYHQYDTDIPNME
jgi:hypothetical protein